MNLFWQKLVSVLPWVAASSLAIAACILFYFSANHPINADLAMLHYSAWLMNQKDFVLYRDIFEINFPAPFLLHQLIGTLAGYDAGPLRLVDLLSVTIIGWISWNILKPLSRASALAAPCLFTLIYWINAGEFSLERDYLGTIPAAAAFLIAALSNKKILARCALTGTLCGAAISMKPNFAVIMPALLFMLWHRHRLECVSKNTAPHAVGQISALLLSCCAIISALPFIWIFYKGGLQEFIHIYKTFLPIYARCRYDLWHYENDAERTAQLISNYLKFSTLSMQYAAPGLVWAWFCNRHNPKAKHHILYLSLTIFTFTGYELIAGKFWLSHLLPSVYWTVMGFSLLLASPQPAHKTWINYCGVFVVIIFSYYAFMTAKFVIPQMQSAYKTINQERTRSQKIADFLKSNLQPGDTVQAMDMAGDGQSALLAARATSSTRHLIDVPLYMEPQSPETQALRQEFVEEMYRKKPTYIVYIQNLLHPGGGNRLREFKGFYSLIESDYEIELDGGDDFIVYRLGPDKKNQIKPWAR